MGLDLVKYLVLLFTTNIFEVCLLLYGIYFHQDWRMAILFPVLVPAIIAITLHKNRYFAKLFVSVASMLSLVLVQNAFALFWGDNGTFLGMMLFSFLFTVIPTVVYILAITILHWIRKTPLKTEGKPETLENSIRLSGISNDPQ